MKSRFLVLFICLLATVSMIGCDFFDSDDGDDVITSYGSLLVKVVEATDNTTEVAAPTFTIAGSSATGVYQNDSKSYLFANVAVSDKVSVKVEKTGYLNASAFATVTTNNTTVTQISLIKEADLDGPIAAIDLSVDDPAVVTFDTDGVAGDTASDVKIKFAKNSVKNGDNIVTAPEVKVAYKAPPATADALAAFPGNFEGMPTGGTTSVPFETYGFIYVDLGAGNELTETASLTMPTTAAAPNTMPVWSYNETTGIWEQTGTAEKKELPGGSGNWFYEAAVDHFSWYNLDAPIENVSRLDVIVASYTYTFDEEQLDREGEEEDANKTDLTKRISGATVVVATRSAAGDTFTWREVMLTNSNGVASFNIPEGRTYTISVKTADAEQEGYSYEVKDGVATAFVNMNSMHHWQ